MKGKTFLAVTVLVCAWITGAHAQRIERRWRPPQGAWAVTKVLLPSGREACSLTTRAPPNGPAGLAANIILDLYRTQFQFIYAGPEIPPVRQVMLFADKRFITTLPVVSQGKLAGVYLLAADMPGDLLRRRVLPALADARGLSIQAGVRAYVILIGNVGTLSSELSACAAEIIAHARR